MKKSILLSATAILGACLFALLAFSQPSVMPGFPIEEDPKMKENWSTGSLKAEGKMVNGLRQGTWSCWYANGNRSELGNYHEGVRTSTWTYWREDGALDRLETYPRPGFLKRTSLSLNKLGDLSQTDGWQTLALGASYCLEHAYNHPETKTANINKGVKLIDLSISRDDNVWNNYVRAQLYEYKNFNTAQASAKKALELGVASIPNFKESEEYKYLVELINKANEGGC